MDPTAVYDTFKVFKLKLTFVEILPFLFHKTQLTKNKYFNWRLFLVPNIHSTASDYLAALLSHLMEFPCCSL